jgi:hypothetical protein
VSFTTEQATTCPRALKAGAPHFAAPSPVTAVLSQYTTGHGAIGYADKRRAMVVASINVWPLGPQGRASG